MKNLRLLPFLLFFLFQFHCNLIDEIKGLKEFEFDLDLSKSFPVDISEEDPNTINEVFTLDAKSNPDIADYLNDIEEYDIWSIAITITNYEGAENILFSGTLTIGNFVADFTGENALNPYQLATNGGLYYLNLDADDLKLLNSYMLGNHKLEGTLVGSVSDQPVKFTVNVWLVGYVYGEA